MKKDRFVAILLSLAIAGCSGNAALPAKVQAPNGPGILSLKVGSRAPAFTAQTLDGKRVSLADYRGKTLLLLFSTTWCYWCQQEAADVVKEYHALHSSKVAFLRVDSQESISQVRAYAETYGEPYPVALDPDGKIRMMGYANAFPTAYAIDPNGIVRAAPLSPDEYAVSVHAAELGKSFIVPDSAVGSVLALIDPVRFSFAGNEAHVLSEVQAAQAAEVADLPKMPAGADDGPYMAMERRLNTKIIAALSRFTKDKAGMTAWLNARMQNDEISFSPTGAYQRDQLAVAQTLLSINPSYEPAAWGEMSAYAGLKQPAKGLNFALRFENKYPTPEIAYDLSRLYGYQRNGAMQAAAWEQKSAQRYQELAAANPTDANLTKLANAAYHAAFEDARLGEAGEAKRFYEIDLNALAKIKRPPSNVAVEIQNAQEGLVYLSLSDSKQRTKISLAPWTGAPLPGSVANTIKYRLVVVGKANNPVQLVAQHYAKGWLPSFCTDNLCSPMQRTLVMPPAGIKVVEFQMVPNDPAAPASSPVTVVASGNGSTAVANVVSSRNVSG